MSYYQRPWLIRTLDSQPTSFFLPENQIRTRRDTRLDYVQNGPVRRKVKAFHLIIKSHLDLPHFTLQKSLCASVSSVIQSGCFRDPGLKNDDDPPFLLLLQSPPTFTCNPQTKEVQSLSHKVFGSLQASTTRAPAPYILAIALPHLIGIRT